MSCRGMIQLTNTNIIICTCQRIIRLTCIGRIEIEGITAHCRGPSDDNTGENIAEGKGSSTDNSHG